MKRIELINKKFPHAFWGYDVTEVDLFIDEIIKEFDRLHNELDIADFTAETARDREEKLKAKIAELTAKLRVEGPKQPEAEEAAEQPEAGLETEATADEPEAAEKPDAPEAPEDPLSAYGDEDGGA